MNTHASPLQPQPTQLKADNAAVASHIKQEDGVHAKLETQAEDNADMPDVNQHKQTNT